jgi:hypothetical protein
MGSCKQSSGERRVFGEWMNNAKARRMLAPLIVEMYESGVGISTIAARLARQECCMSRARVIKILKHAKVDVGESRVRL